MTPEEIRTRKNMLLELCDAEDASLLRVVEAVPEQCVTWKPEYEKARPFNKLAIHAGSTGMFFLSRVTGMSPGEPPATPATKAELIEHVRALTTAFIDGVKKLSEEQLGAEIEIFGKPTRAIELLWWHVLHLIHHRAQLGMYLRLMGAKVPSVYGPSGDET